MTRTCKNCRHSAQGFFTDWQFDNARYQKECDEYDNLKWWQKWLYGFNPRSAPLGFPGLYERPVRVPMLNCHRFPKAKEATDPDYSCGEFKQKDEEK